jgi:hypothetical protein
VRNDGISTFTNNVGIGTFSPVNIGGYTALTLNNSTTGGILTFQQNGVNKGSIYNGDSSNMYFGNNSGNTIFETGGSPRMTITSGGNVLIGTTTDAGYKLSVNGTGSFAGSPTVTGRVYIQSGHQWSLNADQSGGGSPAFAGSGFYIKNENTNTIALGFNTGGAATFIDNVTAGQFISFLHTAQGAGANGISDGPFFRYVNTTNSYQILKQINANTDEDTWTIRGGGWNKVGTLNAVTGVYTALSDRNKKKDFEESTIGLNAILGLKPTLYRMLDEDESVKKQLGFIAQEVKDYIPQACVEQDNFIGLQDRPIIAALVNAIKELKAELDELKSKN